MSRKVLWTLGCAALAATPLSNPADNGAPPAARQPVPLREQLPAPPVNKVVVGRNVWLEIQGDKRRVGINAVVCNRDCTLEHLLCRRHTKEHEAILTADIDAAKVHLALLLAGAEPGRPAVFGSPFRPATGTVIKIFLHYAHRGEPRIVPAQSWVRYIKDGKPLRSDWVFAGSFLVHNALNPLGRPVYAANDGDVFCVANFDAALLDLPFYSSASSAEMLFETFTERIPPLETPVVVMLEPVR
jgi:hypothetical protein